MPNKESLTISKVRPGAVLLEDVFSGDQTRLFSAGYSLSFDDIQTLKKCNVHEIVISAEPNTPSKDSATVNDSAKSRPTSEFERAASSGLNRTSKPDLVERRYSKELLQQAEKCLSNAGQVLQRAIHRMSCNLAVPAASLTAAWQEFLQVARMDSGVALCTLADRNLDTKNLPASEVIVSQSVLRAGLASVLAIESGLDYSTCASIATAAMVHDISQLEEMRPVVARLVNGPLTTKLLQQEHSILSSQLFGGIDGISDSTIQMIREVHEQIDGSGYPMGLMADQISFGGRILNVVDCYVRMVSDHQEDPYFPADVLAHIVYHTREGAFDREVVCHLLSATSMYPVGTPVELDDATDAVVYRSSGAEYTHPIVMKRIDDEEQVCDLRKIGQTIARPLQDQRQSRSRRIRMSSMQHRLWMENQYV